jgi:predicted ribosome quality control (RQC) complex YloA/Tae2 family protein
MMLLSSCNLLLYQGRGQRMIANSCILRALGAKFISFDRQTERRDHANVDLNKIKSTVTKEIARISKRIAHLNSVDISQPEKYQTLLIDLKLKHRQLCDLQEEILSLAQNDTDPISIANRLRDIGIVISPVSTPRKMAPPPRKPYKIYSSIDGIDIYVGRSASDNDELSLNPTYRHDDEWWLHVLGYPGGHVVVKCTSDSVPSLTLLDAAYLAALVSKAPGNIREITVTRCRYVKKNSWDPDGRVQLTKVVKTIAVNMKRCEKDIARLITTLRP